MPGVIRLRESIERWLRHRWLGPVLLILLVLLLGMLAFHEGLAKLFESAGELCVALALFALARLGGRPRPVTQRTLSQPWRGPPWALLAVRAAALPAPSPLRL